MSTASCKCRYSSVKTANFSWFSARILLLIGVLPLLIRWERWVEVSINAAYINMLSIYSINLQIGGLFLLFWFLSLVVNLVLAAVLILLQSVFSLASLSSNLTLDLDFVLNILLVLLSTRKEVIYGVCVLLSFWIVKCSFCNCFSLRLFTENPF